MTRTQTTLYPMIIALVLLVAGSVSAQDGMTDPYDIFEKYIVAIGGFDKIEAESTSYFESTIEVAGLTGTVTTWSKTPNFNRQNVDLKVFKNSGGDNGEVQWSTDANGKVQYHRDENMLKRRELQKYTRLLMQEKKILTVSIVML